MLVMWTCTVTPSLASLVSFGSPWTLVLLLKMVFACHCLFFFFLSMPVSSQFCVRDFSSGAHKGGGASEKSVFQCQT